MTHDRLNRIIAKALSAERDVAFRKPVKPLDDVLVDLICSGKPRCIVIELPPQCPN